MGNSGTFLQSNADALFSGRVGQIRPHVGRLGLRQALVLT